MIFGWDGNLEKIIMAAGVNMKLDQQTLQTGISIFFRLEYFLSDLFNQYSFIIPDVTHSMNTRMNELTIRVTLKNSRSKKSKASHSVSTRNLRVLSESERT